MKQKLKGINTCKFCGKTYEVGFFGAGYKYCSHSCNRKGRALADKERFKKYNNKDKDCNVCGRSIKKVGKRKSVNKYCSKKCMILAQAIRSGRKYCTIKIPIKELPELFGQIK